MMSDALAEGCEHLALSVTDHQKKQMLDHLVLLERWNRKLNLTAIVSAEQMVVRHLLDSLSIARLVQGQRLIDIGSGGGFPGMPIAVIKPDLDVTLLDSRGKRVEFLRHVVAHNRLANVSTVKSRIEDYRPPEKFDTLVSRAFSSLHDMLHWTSHLHQPGGQLLAMKGKRPEEELAQLEDHWQCQIKTEAVKVPMLEADRHVVILSF